MQRSSETIAALVTALAKAQTELTNPEKSLIGKLEANGSPARSFRYASLSSGLEIVRKTLGHHELAVFQATAVDQASGLINLTTTLAHKSGEWISSDWPVCRLADTASPRRMGAALTYARRYALFTLVGIAGEDDLDAQDGHQPPLSTGPTFDPGPGAEVRTSSTSSGEGSFSSLRKARKPVPVRITLPADASAESRDRLLDAISKFNSMKDAASWARTALTEKNKLTAPDALRVEKEFQAKAAGFRGNEEIQLQANAAQAAGKVPATQPVDKSALKLGEPKRRRDKVHLQFVRTRPCLVCGRSPADAHHIRYAQPKAMGRKVSDEFTVPVCRVHHRQLHGVGDEFAWWRTIHIDPMEAAHDLWSITLERRDGVSSPSALHSP